MIDLTLIKLQLSIGKKKSYIFGWGSHPELQYGSRVLITKQGKGDTAGKLEPSRWLGT